MTQLEGTHPDLTGQQETSYITYALLLVFGALFLYLFSSFLGFTIKYLISQISKACCVQRRVVGIFSYSAPEEYHWITQGLNSGNLVESTFPSIISNNNKAKFRQNVENCDFAILYHTKNRGRVNLTNVTDSLYDDELRYMSRCKGRLNVIVVIDDLDKNDYAEKHRILEHQPDIAEYARDLILVSNEDKRHQGGINKKLQQIEDLMSDDYGSRVQYFEYIVSMARWVWSSSRGRTGCCKISSHQSPEEGLDAPLLV